MSHSGINATLPHHHHHHHHQQQHTAEINKKRSGWVNIHLYSSETFIAINNGNKFKQQKKKH